MRDLLPCQCPDLLMFPVMRHSNDRGSRTYIARQVCARTMNAEATGSGEWVALKTIRLTPLPPVSVAFRATMTFRFVQVLVE